MYKAIADFKDLKDDGYVYRAGDVYPRAGYDPTEKRLNDLLSSNNKRGRAVIIAIEDKKPVSEKIPAETEPETPVEKPRRGRKPKNK